MPTSATSPAFSLWHAPEPLVEQLAAVHRVVQQEQARLMRLAAAMAASVPPAQREFVADDLALVMNVHPRTGAVFVHRAVTAARLPGLLAAMEAGQLTDRHVAAVVEEVERWTPDEDQQARVVAAVLERLQAQRGLDEPWPAPGQLRRRVAAAALLLDLTAAEQAKKTAAQRRGVSCLPTAVAEGTLSISGPDVQAVAMSDAIRARAEALGRVPGDTRTLQQRMFDAAYDLLTVDATGGESAVPGLDLDGTPVTIRVRGLEISVLMPCSVGAGGNLELAEIPGFGPLLPSTARELLAQADAVRRIAVDASSGAVIAVDDRLPLPRHDADQPPDAPGVFDSVMEHVLALFADRPLRATGELRTDRYRIPTRITRAVRARDRTCAFPGCPVPAHRTDTDHRDPWPHGPTSTGNLHALCRHHHRAKQGYFTVELDPDGHTVWTTPDGRRYRRPPPRY